MGAHTVLHDLATSDMTIPDPDSLGTFVIDRSPFLCEMETSTLEYRTLYDPNRAGLRGTFILATDGGDCTIVAESALNASGHTFIVFDDANDFAEVISVSDGAGGYRWQIVNSGGVSTS